MGARRSPEAVSLAVAVFFVAVLNLPFWRLLYRVVEPRGLYDWTFMASLFVALLALTYMVVMLLAVRPLLRPVVGVLLPLTAAASYFMLEYGTVIDVNMIRNILETDTREAGDLFSTKLMFYVGLLGLLPAILLWRVPIAWPSLAEDFRRKVKAALITLPIAAAALYPFIPALTSTFRENRALRMTLTPTNYLSGLNKYVRAKLKTHAVAPQPIATDAKRVARTDSAVKRHAFVVVVGETARADHWTLNGYARATTPRLAQIADLVNFPNATSCGTDTAYSVPCMFSGLGRPQFSNAKAAARHNLLDVLAATGFDVVWRENQSGCKGVCDRIKTEVLTGVKHPTFYAYSENHDEILLEGLADRIRASDKDIVIVLHTMGSHGPAYWKRYPSRFEVFKPVCQEAQFSRCQLSEIVNAYDNTILYSDHVLAELIGLLEGVAADGTIATGMVYMSDHGESLGEKNIFLHGMPYAIAPEAQKRIPMAVWLSKSMREAAAVDLACLKANAGAERSHDNLFHSVLGILDVKTSVYDPALDVFAACRGSPSAAAPTAGSPVP